MIGQTISHYQIVEKLGEGGMGVVYKARDTKLDRDVALKFLPPHLAASEQDRARFVQEAKAAAALNHPNVCSIIDIQEHENQMFIVMEFVDGQTLREKLNASPQGTAISMKQAIDLGIQIADGLAAAHEKGIVHRDIKPENIMIRRDGIAQIMDFGLAKLRSSTMTKLTKAGSTIGTVGYMSPEQVQGQETDHRSDIFSLGVLLFELFTGSLPFKGMHETAVAYEIVNVDSPPMSSIRTDIPPELDAIVFDCLEKDPKERTQAASQVGLELKRYRRESSRNRASRITAARPIQAPPTGSGAASGIQQPVHQSSPGMPVQGEPTADRGRGSRRFGAAVLGIVALVALAAGYFATRFIPGRSGSEEPLRLSVELPPQLSFFQQYGGNTVISPDGKTVAFVGTDSVGRQTLWIRPISSDQPVQLAGTDGAIYPFWSPDSRSIGFFAGGKLKRVDINGSPALTLADAQTGRGGAWSPQGVIVFAPVIGQKDLFQVPASGGTPVPVTHSDSTDLRVPRFPFFLPDGKHFLYVTMDLGAGASYTRTDYQAWVGSLDGESVKLPLRGTSNIYYASGYIVYLRQTTLIAQAFDPESFTIGGDPIPIRTTINFHPQRAKGDFSVSGNGILLFGPKFGQGNGEILLVDRGGKETSLVKANPDDWIQFSPDGKRIAFVESAEEDGNVDVWTFDLARKLRTRFTFEASVESYPVWSPDGSTMYFSSRRGSKVGIFSKPTDGMGEEREVAGSPAMDCYMSDISRDGRYLLLNPFSDSTADDVGFVDLAGDSSVQLLVSTKYNEDYPRFSPDGRWVVYSSAESGGEEVYVRPFGQAGGKGQVSAGGGSRPLWAKSGEIFFRSGEMEMAVAVSTEGGRPVYGVPTPLFQVGGDKQLEVTNVTDDGKTFLARRTETRDQGRSMQIIIDWPALTKK
jgi:serine/threonine protein kinase/Tol biopolymer transport system component